MDDMSEYKDIFLAELSENISLLNNTLLEVEKNPSNDELIQDLVRAAHTVKGMASTMGFDKLTELTHSIEDHLSSLNKLNDDLIQTLFKSADKMQEFHDAVEDDEDVAPIEVKPLINELKEGKAEPQVIEEEPQEEGELKMGSTFQLEIKFSADTQLLGARGFQAYRVIDSIAQITESDPTIDVLEAGELVGDINMEIITYESEAEIRNSLSQVEDIKEIVISRLIDEPEPKVAGVKTKRAIQSVRVKLDKLDRVIDLLGELVITRGRFQSLIPNVTPEISEQFQIFDTTINTIQEEVMSLRMVDLSRIFDTFPRTVRDIARDRNMEIDLVLQGTHIQLDRSVVDQVNEALLHLVRNAAIHGIEDPSVRKEAGKPETGKIRLAARRERGEVVFEVEDDGRGLDIDAIRAKAIEKGLMSKDDPLTRSQVAALIFRPGFSTASELTQVAGRGVGMDIVKATIDEISGSIEVRTKKGKGTRFIIRVPQTLAIIDAIIVEVSTHDPQQFAIPLINVEKVFATDDSAIRTHEGQKYLHWEGYNVRIVNLEQRMIEVGMIKPRDEAEDEIGEGYDISEEDTERIRERQKNRVRRDKILLWERAGNRVALQVSRVLEQREIVTKQLEETSEYTKGFSGATILGYDQVALIIDPDNIEKQFID